MTSSAVNTSNYLSQVLKLSAKSSKSKIRYVEGLYNHGVSILMIVSVSVVSLLLMLNASRNLEFSAGHLNPNISTFIGYNSNFKSVKRKLALRVIMAYIFLRQTCFISFSVTAVTRIP